MEFKGEPSDEGANMLKVFLSGPCFGDTTPSVSPNSATSQSDLNVLLHDEGGLGVYQTAQPVFDDDGDERISERLVQPALDDSSAHSQCRIEGLIDFGGDDPAGAYPAPAQTQLHVHEDLLDLTFEAPVQQHRAQQQGQSHEDPSSIAFEAPQAERYTPGNGYLCSTLQPSGEQFNMRYDTEEHGDSHELGDAQFGDDSYGMSPRTFSEPFSEDEIDELDEDYLENDIVPWPDAQWRDVGSTFPSSSPPKVFSSSPGMPSSQTSLAVTDEDQHDSDTKGATVRLQPLPSFMLEDRLGQMGTTEMNAGNFQDDTETYPETSVLTGDPITPASLTFERYAFEAEPPAPRVEVVRDDVQLHETPFRPDADPDSDDDVEARGSVLPLSLSSPTHDNTLPHPGAYVVAPTLPDQPSFAQALGSSDGDGDSEETRGVVSPSPPAQKDAVHLEPSPGLIDEDRMLVDDPQYGKQQDGETEDEARGMDPPLRSILGDLRGSLAESIEYGHNLDNHLGDEIADLTDDSITSDNVKTSPAEEHSTSLLRGDLNLLASAVGSRLIRTEVSPHLGTDKGAERVAEHDARRAQIIDEDFRESGDRVLENSLATDGYGYVAEQIAFEFPAAVPEPLGKDTALTDEHVEYDDSSVFGGYQEPQGLDAGRPPLPELNYRPEVKALGEPGTQEDAFNYRSLKRQPSRAAAEEERESPRRLVYPSLPNPKRTTAAGQLLQHKKLSKPFKCPTISNPLSTGSATAWRPGAVQLPLSQVKQENEIESFPQVAISLGKEDTKIKHRTRRAGAQFKSPLASLASGQQPLIRPTPTIQALERKAQTLKRAVRVLGDKEEATLQALIAKWTEAGREVAYELWTMVRDSGGEGISSGRAVDREWTRKRKVEESWGWDDGNERRASFLGSNGSIWGLVPVPEGDAEHAEDGEDHDASEQHDEGEGRVHETVGTMLMQLGVRPWTLGWDEDEGCFVG